MIRNILEDRLMIIINLVIMVRLYLNNDFSVNLD